MTPVPDCSHDAHDLELNGRLAKPSDLLSNCPLTRPRFARKQLVDNHHSAGIRSVGRLQPASFDHSDIDGREIRGTRSSQICVHTRAIAWADDESAAE
jgi:hypothetical protein